MAGFVKRTKRTVRRVTNGYRQRLIHDTPEWLRRSIGPTASYFDMLFVDHGIFREIYANCHPLSEKAWRSAQPAPRHLRHFARKGIRTIINLRGERDCGSFWLEQKACERYGLKLINFQIRSRAAPTRQDINEAKSLFENVEYPVLMHCKSGADRAGMMSALYRFLHEGVPIEEAKNELSLKYGHFRQADTGILDGFFDKYLEDNAVEPMPFLEWVETKYDPDNLRRKFRSRGWANRLVDSVLRRE